MFATWYIEGFKSNHLRYPAHRHTDWLTEGDLFNQAPTPPRHICSPARPTARMERSDLSVTLLPGTLLPE